MPIGTSCEIVPEPGVNEVKVIRLDEQEFCAVSEQDKDEEIKYYSKDAILALRKELLAVINKSVDQFSVDLKRSSDISNKRWESDVSDQELDQDTWNSWNSGGKLGKEVSWNHAPPRQEADSGFMMDIALSTRSRRTSDGKAPNFKPFEISQFWVLNTRFTAHEVQPCHVQYSYSIESTDGKSLFLDGNCPPLGKEFAGDVVKSDTVMQNFVVHPASKFRLLWVGIGVILIMFDVITVPLIAFEVTDAPLWEYANNVTLWYWSMDFLLSFLIGYHNADQVVEMRPVMVMRYYLRTWFLADTTILLMDWALMALRIAEKESNLVDGSGFLRATKGIRLSRLLRLVRLVRIVKMVGLGGALMDTLRSEAMIVVAKIVRLIFLIVLVNHFLACSWYALARFTDDPENTWLAKYIPEDKSKLYLYFTSLHWSITQFTPATQDIAPTNVHERIFAIFVVLNALVAFSTFLSSMTAAIGRLIELNSTRTMEDALIRAFLSQRRISVLLGNRIWDAIRKRRQGAKTTNLSIKDVPFFQDMPLILQRQLRSEMYAPRVRIHPVFNYFFCNEWQVMSRICHIAVDERQLPPLDNIFIEGEAGPEAFFTMDGKFEYRTKLYNQAIIVKNDHMIAEGVLWGTWTYRGRLTALSVCTVVSLKAKTFEDIAESITPYALRIMRVYALAWEQRVSEDLAVLDLEEDPFTLEHMWNAAETGEPKLKRSSVRSSIGSNLETPSASDTTLGRVLQSIIGR